VTGCASARPDPTTWTEIRLAGFFAPELNEPGGRTAKAALELFEGRRGVCTAVRGANGSTRSYDRLIANCKIDSRPLERLLREAGVAEGGRGRW
jgi:micrococcal nuclease